MLILSAKRPNRLYSVDRVLAIEEKNAQGGIDGRYIKVIQEDDQSEPKQTVTAFRKLIAVHKISIVIGGMTSSSALAVAPIAEQNKVVFLSPSASAPKLSDAGDFIFRNELSDTYGGSSQAELTWSKLGLKRIAILYINNDYGVGVKDAFQQTFSKLEGQVVEAQPFDPDAQDFRSQLTLIKVKSPDGIFIIAYKEAISILRQIRELGIKATLLSTPVFEDREILEKAGNAAEDVIYVYYGGFDTQSGYEEVKGFVETFRKKYNREPGYYSALAYDAANIVLLAITNGSTQSEDIKKALYQIRDFPGVTGITTFDSHGDIHKPVILKTVKNGKFIELK